MENKILIINQNELESLIESFSGHDAIFIAEIDGNTVHTLHDYFDKICEVFKFPYLSKSLDGYLDWMTDLSWLNASEFALIIIDYKDFMQNDLTNREKVMWLFENDILPFWQSEIEQCVVEGKAKPFNVYLVD